MNADPSVTLSPCHPVTLSPSPEATSEQKQAVSCREASVVLSSGAGCGKTHVLTERYLSHLRADGAEVGQIAAFTFTDRAARQMRERIRKALTHELRAAADADVERWARHLRGLETASIGTIHAFCGALLRQHAIEAGLDPRFEVLEDVLSANLEAEALTTCLQQLLTDPTPAGEDLRQLVLLYGWKPAVDTVRHLMRKADAVGWTRWLERPAESIVEQWQSQDRNDLLPRYVNYLIAACPKIAHCLWLLQTTPCRGTQMRENVARLLAATPRLAEAKDLAAAVTELTEAAKVGKERAKAWPSEEVYEAVKAAFEDFRKELPSRLQLFLEPAENGIDAVIAGQRFVRVAGEVVDAYRQIKRREGVLDFQDLLVLARDLLRDQPEVRRQLQRRYRFLLIDELQDTDPVQMELVEHLCGAELTAGKLFAVGDHKQSIYRFRGADVHLFQNLRQQVPHAGRLGLTVNFRSQPAILDFVNALLGPRMVDYEPLQPHHPQVNPGPCVEFLWSPREDKEHVNEARSQEADWIARRIAAMVRNREALVLERATSHPRRLEDSPAGLKVSTQHSALSTQHLLRPVRSGDIVLLFRAMSNVHLYEAALRKYGLDYYLVGGRAFFAQQEIYDLLNLLRALENPQDGISLAGTLRSPFCCLNDEALFVLARNASGLWAGLHDAALHERLPADQRESADRARRFLDRWRGLKDRLPIARLLGEVCADSGYDAALQFELLGDRKLANLWKLMELARTFDRSGRFGLAEFIQRLGDLVRTQPREEQAATQPENADVVRLMTIHQAKGLEFPVVFVPDLAAAGGSPHSPLAAWHTRLGCVVRPPVEEDQLRFSDFGWQLWKTAEAIEDWHEDLRTLYVACTRAQDYLVLSAALTQPVRPANAWMLTLAECFDLRTGACRDNEVPAERVPQVRVVSGESLVVSGQESGVRSQESGEESSFLSTQHSPLSTPQARRLACGLETPLTTHHSPLTTHHSLPAYQFDAEDGSDRTDWVWPRDHCGWQDGSEVSLRDRVLRDVLERWDWHNTAGWQPLLAQAVEDRARSSDPQRLQAELDPLLARFAGSETFRHLASAQTCYRELEFLLAWPVDSNHGRRTTIGGVIDCLWQDGQGDWHLLAFMTDAKPASDLRVSLWAWAVEHHLGAWPKSVTLYSFPSGETTSLGGRELRDAKTTAEIQAALTSLLE